MSAVETLLAAITATDAAVKRGPVLKGLLSKKVTKPDPAAAAAKRIGNVANAVATLSNPIASFTKLLTGGASDDWNVFVSEANTLLAGKNDENVSPVEFTKLVSRFVALRAALTGSAYRLPDVTLKMLPTAAKSSYAPYVAIGALAILGGVFLLLKR